LNLLLAGAGLLCVIFQLLHIILAGRMTRGCDAHSFATFYPDLPRRRRIDFRLGWHIFRCREPADQLFAFDCGIGLFAGQILLLNNRCVVLAYSNRRNALKIDVGWLEVEQVAVSGLANESSLFDVRILPHLLRDNHLVALGLSHCVHAFQGCRLKHGIGVAALLSLHHQRAILLFSLFRKDISYRWRLVRFYVALGLNIAGVQTFVKPVLRRVPALVQRLPELVSSLDRFGQQIHAIFIFIDFFGSRMGEVDLIILDNGRLYIVFLDQLVVVDFHIWRISEALVFDQSVKWLFLLGL